jgi:DNA-binding transcriptional MerR regulator
MKQAKAKTNGRSTLMTAGRVAAHSGVPAHTVRWYLRQRLLQPPKNPRNGYYEFTARDLQTLNFVRRAKALGFTLKEIASIFEMSRKRQTPCPMVRDIVAQRLVEFEAEVGELIAMQRDMKRALRQWRELPDGVPDGEEICRLIEATGGAGVDLRVARKSSMSKSNAALRRKRNSPGV